MIESRCGWHISGVRRSIALAPLCLVLAACDPGGELADTDTDTDTSNLDEDEDEDEGLCYELPVACEQGDPCMADDELSQQHLQVLVELVAEFELEEVFTITSFEVVERPELGDMIEPRLGFHYAPEGFDYAATFEGLPMSPELWEVFMRDLLDDFTTGPVASDEQITAAMQACAPEAVYEPCVDDTIGLELSSFGLFATKLLPLPDPQGDLYMVVERHSGELISCVEYADPDEEPPGP